MEKKKKNEKKRNSQEQESAATPPNFPTHSDKILEFFPQNDSK
jgi:hypothetical protein